MQVLLLPAIITMPNTTRSSNSKTAEETLATAACGTRLGHLMKLTQLTTLRVLSVPKSCTSNTVQEPPRHIAPLATDIFRAFSGARHGNLQVIAFGQVDLSLDSTEGRMHCFVKRTETDAEAKRKSFALLVGKKFVRSEEPASEILDVERGGYGFLRVGDWR